MNLLALLGGSTVMRAGGIEPPRGADTPLRIPSPERLPVSPRPQQQGGVRSHPVAPAPAEFWNTNPGSAGFSFLGPTHAQTQTLQTQETGSDRSTTNHFRQVERRDQESTQEKTGPINKKRDTQTRPRGNDVSRWARAPMTRGRSPSPTGPRRRAAITLIPYPITRQARFAVGTYLST